MSSDEFCHRDCQFDKNPAPSEVVSQCVPLKVTNFCGIAKASRQFLQDGRPYGSSPLRVPKADKLDKSICFPLHSEEQTCIGRHPVLECDCQVVIQAAKLGALDDAPPTH